MFVMKEPMKNAIKPYSRWFIKEGKTEDQVQAIMNKISEQTISITFYIIFFTYGHWVLRDKPYWPNWIGGRVDGQFENVW
jgi:hypothetical protein